MRFACRFRATAPIPCVCLRAALSTQFIIKTNEDVFQGILQSLNIFRTFHKESLDLHKQCVMYKKKLHKCRLSLLRCGK